MGQELNTFWMIPRGVLNAPASAHVEQRALITCNVLFGGPLIISDSDLINNLYIRENLHTRFVRDLLERGFLSIARRNFAGQPIPLRKVAETIKRKSGGLLKNVEDRPFDDLDSIEAISCCIDYDLAEAQPRYESEVLRVLRLLNAREDLLPAALSKTIIDVLEENSLPQAVTWSTFDPTSTLWNTIHRRHGDDTLRERFGRRVFEVARGPYSTFIPGTLKIGATYSSEDQVGIDLWRGRYGMTNTEIERLTIRSYTLSPADTVAGLAMLTVDDIERLRSSKALQAYEDGCDRLGFGETGLNEIKDAFLTYRAEVNYAIMATLRQGKLGEIVDHEQILSELTPAPSTYRSRMSDFILRASIVAEEEARAFLQVRTVAVGREMLTSFVDPTPALLGLFIHGRVQARKGIKEAAATSRQQEIVHDKEHQKAMAKFLDHHPATVTSSQVLNDTSRDLFTIVNP